MNVRPWIVSLVPLDETGSKRETRGHNLGGIGVTLTDGDDEVFVTRVAFVRRNSRNPDTDFADQLRAEIDKAEDAAEVLNDYLDDRERQLEERFVEIQDRVRQALGEPGEVPA